MINLDLRYCVYTERTPEGFIRYAPDAYGRSNQDGGGAAAGGTLALESICPFGFLSRPRAPDVDADGNPIAARAAGLLVLEHGGTDYAIPLQDPRIAETLPAIKEGESILFGQAGQFIRFHDDSSISIYTTHDGTPDGRTLSIMLTPAEGFVLNTPWGTVKFGPAGFHVLHSSGARIDLGAIAGLPAPLDVLSSYVKIQASMASVRGSAVSLGSDAGAANAAAVLALQVLVTAMAGAFATMLPLTGLTPVQQTAIAAALAAFTPLAPNIGKVV